MNNTKENVNTAEEKQAGTRRRGEELEGAILQAAWDELSEVGYTQLTMEGVAVRARTNKNALYRRWPNKAKLVIAATIKHIPKPDKSIPDSGDLREDILTLLQRIVKPMELLGAETIHGLMVDYIGKDIISSMPQLLKGEDELTVMMRTILGNADKRGEVKLDTIPARVLSLPADLIRYTFLTTHKPVTEESITEIIDDIFLPLVRIP
ncbi:TetR/AcrR family transcriptional regulator [Paenibacillus sp. PR3]|uniref:TetR/AcrR family transcriptional regulator n=1 Tax=Paenibacillus terricola TaxID=2763503 RepID=A0ABR8MUT9_9BACL|nr:TetR/AcrR family transcriptional regulator [Paenibacillus terricola]MBD3919345.1 TetR/AcrR family transcriptional regulator [Paenibacillus terricola]